MRCRLYVVTVRVRKQAHNRAHNPCWYFNAPAGFLKADLPSLDNGPFRHTNLATAVVAENRSSAGPSRELASADPQIF